VRRPELTVSALLFCTIVAGIPRCVSGPRHLELTSSFAVIWEEGCSTAAERPRAQCPEGALPEVEFWLASSTTRAMRDQFMR
jgi:hypothetical protein